MKKRKPFIIIISGPSGVGKGTIIQKVLKLEPHIKMAISATTRKPRSNEVDGKDYYFLNKEIFNKYVEEDFFLEWCYVHNQKYGTLKSEVDSYLKQGYDIILEIDIQGASKIKKLGGRILSVFITPPSFQDLIDRLYSRNTEPQEIIEQRLEVAGKELAAIHQYDYVVVNKDIETAVQDVHEIIKMAREEII